MTDSSPGDSAPRDITGLLLAWRAGDQGAKDQLMRLVYDELKRQAARAMRHEDVAHTLQPTALVNEAYLRLVDQTRIEWRNRAQFFGVAAEVMRRILVDHARNRLAEKRGGGLAAVSLNDALHAGDQSGGVDGMEVLLLHEAIERLSVFDPVQARIIELRYFAGLTIEDTAEALHTSSSTIKREWKIALAWLRLELER
ncbi:MAG TPA: sigma-70 family RNA polymerase sigma factor [Gemmatimonadaceae bacterium]